MTTNSVLPAPPPPSGLAAPAAHPVPDDGTPRGAPRDGGPAADARAPRGDERGSDFARLSRRIAGAGLLDRRPGYYVARFAAVATLYLGTIALLVVVGDSWWQLGVAALLAVASGQVALVSHDLAHGQVFRSRRHSRVAGMFAGNVGLGMSYGWWTDKHTRHHANPNDEELDPDVSPDVLVWSEGQARASHGLARFIGRWQAFFFFPLLTLEGISVHVNSVQALARPTLRHRRWEAGLLALHAVWYLGLLLLVLPPGKALLFLVVHQALFGVYLGLTFAPNHKGMPAPEPGHRHDFLRKQVLTSRNVSGGRLVDTALGGLNHQIEHHLFPSMPTANLRRAKPIVKAYCAEIGVPYHETGLVSSYAEALRHLHDAGAPIRAGDRAETAGAAAGDR